MVEAKNKPNLKHNGHDPAEHCNSLKKIHSPDCMYITGIYVI